jgi:hypothetical protein
MASVDSSTEANVQNSTSERTARQPGGIVERSVDENVRNRTDRTVQKSTVQPVKNLTGGNVQQPNGGQIGNALGAHVEQPTDTPVPLATDQQEETPPVATFDQYMFALAQQSVRRPDPDAGPKPQYVTFQVYPAQDYELDQLRTRALGMLMRAGIPRDKRRFDKSVFVRDALDLWLNYLEMLVKAEHDPQLRDALAVWARYMHQPEGGAVAQWWRGS